MKLKKSILLFATVALGSMLGASADDFVLDDYQGIYTFEQDWKSEAVPKSATPPVYQDCRQGFGQNNQFIIQNMNASVHKVQIYDKNGYVGDFAASGIGGNITKDEAGNVIVRTGTFNYPYFMSNQLMFIKADGSQSVSVTLPADYAPRTPGYFWGSAEGDIFSAEGGKLSFTGASLECFITIEIKNGAITGGYQVNLPYLFGSTNMSCSVDDVVNAWKDANGNRHYMVVHRSENPIDITITLDENNKPTATATTINTHAIDAYGTSNGTNTFTLNGKNYIMFSTSPNWNDGFMIAELGTNADGSLDGTVIPVARHMNDYTEPMGANVGSTCNWLNWEPRDSKSIYVYQYFPGYYMARYIFGIKTDETTLADIVNDGEVDQTYTVADQLLIVHIINRADEGHPEQRLIWAKDQGNRSICPTNIKDGQIDYMRDVLQMQHGDWDQSNWVMLKFPNGTNLEDNYEIGQTIKAGTLKGRYIDDVNYCIEVESMQIDGSAEYSPNVYCPVNFLDKNLNLNDAAGQATGGSGKNYFFMNPKVQEVADVIVAVWNGTHFVVPASTGGQNAGNLDGAFTVGWDYNNDYDVHENLVPGQAYLFRGVLNLKSSNLVQGKDVVTPDSNKNVMPFNLDDSTITAIQDIEKGKTVSNVKYYNIMGVESNKPFDGVNIVVTRYSDGTISTTKVLR